MNNPNGIARHELAKTLFGIANGSLAEYTTADENKLAIKPANLVITIGNQTIGQRGDR